MKRKKNAKLHSMLSQKYKPGNKRIMMLLQYFRLKWKSHEFFQEWVGRSWTRAADYDYNECDRRVTKQLKHGLDDEGMISEKLKEVSVLENMDYTTSERVLLWVQRAESPVSVKRRNRKHKRDQGLSFSRVKFTEMQQ